MAKLYFYYAAMNAGKSTTLLQADFNYRECGMETMLLIAELDYRSGVGTVGSRIALSAPAHTFTAETDLFLEVTEERKRRGLHCVLVDEAQFLTRAHVLQLCRLADGVQLVNIVRSAEQDAILKAIGAKPHRELDRTELPRGKAVSWLQEPLASA